MSCFSHSSTLPIASSFSCDDCCILDLRAKTICSFSLTKLSSSSRSSCAFLSLSSFAAWDLSSCALVSLNISSSLESDFVLFFLNAALSSLFRVSLSSEAFVSSFCNQRTSFGIPVNSTTLSPPPSLPSITACLPSALSPVPSYLSISKLFWSSFFSLFTVWRVSFKSSTSSWIALSWNSISVFSPSVVPPATSSSWTPPWSTNFSFRVSWTRNSWAIWSAAAFSSSACCRSSRRPDTMWSKSTLSLLSSSNDCWASWSWLVSWSTSILALARSCWKLSTSASFLPSTCSYPSLHVSSSCT